MQNERKAEIAHLLSNLVITIHVIVLIALILFDDWLPSSTFSILVTLTACSLVILAALEQKYSGVPRKRANAKQMIFAGALGVLIIVAAILLKDFLRAAH